MDYLNDRNRLWEFRGNRGDLFLAPVYVPDPVAATRFFEKYTGNNKWKYNFFTANCKHYVLEGLKAGGAKLRASGPVPIAISIPFTFKWSKYALSPQPYTEPKSNIQPIYPSFESFNF